jgi:hypothetical protein
VGRAAAVILIWKPFTAAPPRRVHNASDGGTKVLHC